MPALLSSVKRYDRHSLPQAVDVLAILHEYEAVANVILPHAEKVLGHQEYSESFSDAQLWLVYTKPGTSAIKFVLSCTEGPMGKYPVFIVPTFPIHELTTELLEDSMEAFCALLPDAVGVKRVFSVFSVASVTRAFAAAWTRLTGIDCIEEPYYDATFSVCSKDTLVRATLPPLRDDVTVDLRLAVEGDAHKIAESCEEFAETSPPFLLTLEQARQEANLMIKNNQVWVFEIRDSSGESDIVSIVAVSRKSSNVAAITKVYTPERCRGMRHAERLVRRVCKELLKKYEKIVLYAGVDNPARKVYARVGFQGLTAESSAVDGAEHWLEIGFDQAKVDLGHW